MDERADAQPYVALCGGDDGLTFYRRIAESYREHLEKGGCLFMEIGYDQAAAVCAIFGAGARVIKDLDGNDRIVAVKG